MSKFIYVSTEENNIGNNPNSDFVVNFHQPLEIKPNSEIRVTECRINPKNDVVEINDNNNVLAFSIGSPWGLDQGAYGGYYNVKLDNGIYDVSDGSDDRFFNFHLQKKMNEAITNNSLFRGGVDVSVTTAGKLKFKICEMNNNNYYYEIPYGNVITSINDGLLEIIKEENNGNIPFNDGNQVIKPFKLSKSAGIGITGDTHDYFGVKLDNNDFDQLYFVSPPLNYFGVNGLEVDEYTPIVVGEIDLTNITTDINASFNLIGENNKGCFYPSDGENEVAPSEFDERSFLFDWGDEQGDIELELCPLKICFDANDGNNTQANIDLHYKEDKQGNHVRETFPTINKAQTISIKISVNNNLVDGKGKLKVEMWEADNTPICDKELEDIDLSLFRVLNREDYKRNWVYNKNSLSKMSNMRVAVVGYSYENAISDNSFPLPISVAFNYDPQEGANGFFNDAFQAENALTKSTGDTIAPFVMHADGLNGRLGAYQALIRTFENTAPYETGFSIINNINPNCGTSLGLNEFGFQGTDVDLCSTGMTAVDIINTNSRENALFFVSCDDLPLLNYTGNVQTGSLNKFVYAIDFNSGSGSRNNIYTSQPDVEKFNTLTNRQTMRIQNMRIRITNIRGQTVENLDDHTYIVFELRENPMMRQERLLQKLVSQRSIAQIQKDQIQPATSQFQ